MPVCGSKKKQSLRLIRSEEDYLLTFWGRPYMSMFRTMFRTMFRNIGLLMGVYVSMGPCFGLLINGCLCFVSMFRAACVASFHQVI